MITFEELMARAAEPTLQGLVGRPVLKLLKLVDPSMLQPDNLRRVALGLHDPSDLLLTPETRRELLSLLPRDQAVLLTQLLGVESNDEYASLDKLSIRRGSKSADALLDFFSVQECTKNERIERPDRESIRPSHGLFSHQRTAVHAIFEQLNKPPNRVLLHMPTGSGKTRTAMNVVTHLLNEGEPRLVVWLAHSEELCEQAVEEFSEAWKYVGNREVSVHRWWGSHSLSNDAIDGVVFAGLSKAYSSARKSVTEIGRLAGNVDLIVMDEAHQAVAPTYQFVLDLLANAGDPTPLLGLSATPGRTWNDIDEDERLAKFFDRRKVELNIPGFANPVDYLVENEYLADVEYDSLLYQSGVELSEKDLEDLATGLEISDRIIKHLAADEQRNLLIVRRAEELMRKHNRLLIFAATVEHARVLATVLAARGHWAKAVTGETPPNIRATVISDYRATSEEPRVLVNFGVLTTGFDAPQTSAAIIARPTRSLVLYSQMLGRATRGPLAGGNSTAVVVTVVDTELPGFASMAEGFHNWEDIWQPR